MNLRELTAWCQSNKAFDLDLQTPVKVRIKEDQVLDINGTTIEINEQEVTIYLEATDVP